MFSDVSFIVGTCETMCPVAEVELRKTNRLVHFFEQQGFVKEFSRSAADKKFSSAKDLRTFAAMQKTLEHLFNKILLNPERPFNVRYDFIFDRLRAVRQEIVMQNFSSGKTLKILEPIVMFLSFSLYRLNGSPLATFDPKICTQHLQECLLKCLSCYEELELTETQDSANRMYIEGIYLLLNMNETSALQRAIRLDARLKTNFIVATAIKISLNYHLRSFYKVLRDIQTMPHLLSAVASLKLPQIRKEILQTFSVAYNSKTLSVPCDFLRKLLVYDSARVLVQDLRQLSVYEGRDDPVHVIFTKAKFDSSKSISNTSHQFVEQKLNDYHLPDLFLLKTL